MFTAPNSTLMHFLVYDWITADWLKAHNLARHNSGFLVPAASMSDTAKGRVNTITPSLSLQRAKLIA